MLDISGTHLYALDARTGKLRWQHNWARHLAGGSGISAKGPLAAGGGKLFMPVGPGGYGGSLRVFGLADGKPDKGLKGSAGADVMVLDTVAYVGGARLMSRGRAPEGAGRLTLSGKAPKFGGSLCMPAASKDKALIVVRLQRRPWRAGVLAIKPDGSGKEALWTAPLPEAARCNGLLLAGEVALAAVPPRKGERGSPAVEAQVLALSAADGKKLWSFPLPGAVAENGLAVDRDGRVLVVLHDGRVLCLAE
jgi:outer membrane protein assembly factor BamB